MSYSRRSMFLVLLIGLSLYSVDARADIKSPVMGKSGAATATTYGPNSPAISATKSNVIINYSGSDPHVGAIAKYLNELIARKKITNENLQKIIQGFNLIQVGIKNTDTEVSKTRTDIEHVNKSVESSNAELSKIRELQELEPIANIALNKLCYVIVLRYKASDPLVRSYADRILTGQREGKYPLFSLGHITITNKDEFPDPNNPSENGLWCALYMNWQMNYAGDGENFAGFLTEDACNPNDDTIRVDQNYVQIVLPLRPNNDDIGIYQGYHPDQMEIIPIVNQIVNDRLELKLEIPSGRLPLGSDCPDLISVQAGKIRDVDYFWGSTGTMSHPYQPYYIDRPLIQAFNITRSFCRPKVGSYVWDGAFTLDDVNSR